MTLRRAMPVLRGEDLEQTRSFWVDFLGFEADAAYADALARGLDVVREIRTESWGPRRFFERLPGGTVVNVVGHAQPG